MTDLISWRDQPKAAPKFMKMIDDASSEEQIIAFFSAEVIRERPLFCPEINVDCTDSWGFFGYQPGFIFIQGQRHQEQLCLNDHLWDQGNTVKEINGFDLHLIRHYDDFPQDRYDHCKITAEGYANIFRVLTQKLNFKVELLGS